MSWARRSASSAQGNVLAVQCRNHISVHEAVQHFLAEFGLVDDGHRLVNFLHGGFHMGERAAAGAVAGEKHRHREQRLDDGGEQRGWHIHDIEGALDAVRKAE